MRCASRSPKGQSPDCPSSNANRCVDGLWERIPDNMASSSGFGPAGLSRVDQGAIRGRDRSDGGGPIAGLIEYHAAKAPAAGLRAAPKQVDRWVQETYPRLRAGARKHGASIFFLDETGFRVRYLVADTASWPSGRSMLISPHAFGDFDQTGKLLHVSLTRQQIEQRPSLGSYML